MVRADAEAQALAVLLDSVSAGRAKGGEKMLPEVVAGVEGAGVGAKARGQGGAGALPREPAAGPAGGEVEAFRAASSSARSAPLALPPAVAAAGAGEG